MILLNSASSAAALVFYLPLSGPSMKYAVHNEGDQSSEYFLKFSKNTIFNEHPVVKKEAISCLKDQETKAKRKGIGRIKRCKEVEREK